MDAAGAAGGSGGGSHRSNHRRCGPNDGDDNAWDGEQRPINSHESTPPATTAATPAAATADTLFTPPAACAPGRPAPSRAAHVGGGDDGSTTPLPQRGWSVAVGSDGGAGPPATPLAPPSGNWPRPSAAAAALGAPPATPPEATDGGGAPPPRRSPLPSFHDVLAMAAALAIPHLPQTSGNPPPAALRRTQFWDVGVAFDGGGAPPPRRSPLPSFRDASAVAAASAIPHWPPASGDPSRAALGPAQSRDGGGGFAAAAVAGRREHGATRLAPRVAVDATPIGATRMERQAIKRVFAAHEAEQGGERADGDAPPAFARQGTAVAAGQRPAKASRQPNLQPETCKVCGDVLSNRHTLAQHVFMKHGGAGKHLCHLCGKRYVRTQDWLGHMKTVHHLERPYRCSWCTDKEVMFGTFGELRRHIDETHDEAKRCDVCGRQWDTVVGMRSHRGHKHKGHHGVGSGKPPEGREQ